MSRPDWLPEEWGFRDDSFLGRCLGCEAVFTKIKHAWRNVFSKDRWGVDKVTGVDRQIRWCDSPDCEASARRAITGEAE